MLKNYKIFSQKIDNHLDLFERDILLKKVELKYNNFPKYLINNREKFKDFIA